jgi:ABC-type glycerol-3-phosphate transport system substrate-binding protein
MIMKKALFLAVAAAFALTACGKSDTPKAPAPATGTTTAPSTPAPSTAPATKMEEKKDEKK